MPKRVHHRDTNAQKSRAGKFRTIGIVLAGIVLFSARGLALELGLTPAQVCSLWNGINQSLLVIARVVSDDAAWRRKLSDLKPTAVQGKNPADVLRLLAAYRAKLDELRRHGGLASIRKFTGDDKPVTPTVVYLNSGLVLNGQIEWLIRNTGPKQLISRFYPNHKQAELAEKTPNDVYAVVQLANIRLAEILARIGVAGRVKGSRSAAR